MKRYTLHRHTALPDYVSIFEWFEGHTWKKCNMASNLTNTPTARQE